MSACDCYSETSSAGASRACCGSRLGRPPSAPASGGQAERAELVERADVRALYQEIIDGLNRELSQFERIKRFAILSREFSIESGELTPSLKVRRKVVEQKWADTIEGLYSEAQ